MSKIFGFERKVFAIILFLIAIRLWLGLKTGVWYQVSTPVDDSLMVNYASLGMHFADISGIYSLSKTIAFPVFLNIVHYSGLSYSFVLSLVWILCACLTIRLVRRIDTQTTPPPLHYLPSPGIRLCTI